MTRQTSKQQGFTIVELLIVIVVIGILAAITIVAFNGIQNRAIDTTVKSDLATAGKNIEIYKIDSDDVAYPHATTSTLLIPQLAKAKIKIATSAYETTTGSATTANFLYFENNNGSDFVLTAKSKSGKIFYYASMNKEVKEYPNPGNAEFPQDGIGALRSFHFSPPADYGAGAWGHGSNGWAPVWINA